MLARMIKPLHKKVFRTLYNFQPMKIRKALHDIVLRHTVLRCVKNSYQKQEKL